MKIMLWHDWKSALPGLILSMHHKTDTEMQTSFAQARHVVSSPFVSECSPRAFVFENAQLYYSCTALSEDNEWLIKAKDNTWAFS